jgi:hypothetical protein
VVSLARLVCRRSHHHRANLTRRLSLGVLTTLCLTLGLTLGLTLSACSSTDRSPVRIVDLVRLLPDAEARPSRAAFEVADVAMSGQSEPAIRTLAPSRLIYVLPVPRRSSFVARVALDGGVDGQPPQPLRFRVGVSDDRVYEPLAEVLLTPGVQTGWTALRASLSAYAGWQWSLFYRPEQRRWRLVLSTDATSGVRGRGVWAAPGIDGDRAAAREHVERAARLSR